MKYVRRYYSQKRCFLRLPNGNLSQTGLTFIEVLLATVMVAVISVALYAMLSNGITVWVELNEETPQIDANLFFERLEIELKNCIYFKNMEFLGGKEGFSFPAVAIGVTRDNGFLEGLGKIEYFYNQGEKALKRSYSDYQNLYSIKSLRERSLINNIEEMNFSYYFFSNEKQQFFFSDVWPPDINEKISRYPQAVRISLVVDLGKKVQRLTRTINIPIAGIRE